MPSARESVQGDRAYADLKLSSSPLVGLALARSTQGSNHSHPLSNGVPPLYRAGVALDTGARFPS